MSNKIIYIGESDLANDNERTIYDFESFSGDKIVMRYSELDNSWTELVRGKKAATLKDSGDGVTIKLRGSKKKIKLDYSQLVELQMLLKYYNEDSSLQSGYTHTVSKLLPTE